MFPLFVVDRELTVGPRSCSGVVLVGVAPSTKARGVRLAQQNPFWLKPFWLKTKAKERSALQVRRFLREEL